MAANIKIGFLAPNGHPHIKIKVWGMNRQFAQEFDAMIDTGFTGFLSMPLTAAFPTALTLYGTTTFQLANGAVDPKLLGYGTVELEDEMVHGPIVLEPNTTGLLVGMEFLKKLNKALVASQNGVWLIDETELKQSISGPPPSPSLGPPLASPGPGASPSES